MSDEDKKEGQQKPAKIDLGLESLLAAVGATKSDAVEEDQANGADVEPSREAEAAAPSYEALYSKGVTKNLNSYA
jgi:hypothetical protein